MTNFQKVKNFMETFGQEVKSSPSFSSPKINELRYNLIKEELNDGDDLTSWPNVCIKFFTF